jgi:NleD-like pathogen effector protein (putative zinc metallopeptidase)
MGGDPGSLGRLTEPAFGSTRYEHRARPVRVSDTPRRSTPGRTPAKAPPPPVKATPAEREALALRMAARMSFDYFKIGEGREDSKPAQDLYRRGQDIKVEYEGYLKDLAKTDVGYRLLSDLDKSKYQTAIQFSLVVDSKTTSQGTGTASGGAAPTITLNPTKTHFPDSKGKTDAPWSSERPKYGFYHELVHAWHTVNGTTSTKARVDPDTADYEWQAVGLGPYAGNDISENAIRRAMGKAERPEYGGKAYPKP